MDIKYCPHNAKLSVQKTLTLQQSGQKMAEKISKQEQNNININSMNEKKKQWKLDQDKNHTKWYKSNFKCKRHKVIQKKDQQ